MGIPLEEYAEASFEIITTHALPMIADAAIETTLRRDMTIIFKMYGGNNFLDAWLVPPLQIAIPAGTFVQRVGMAG